MTNNLETILITEDDEIFRNRLARSLNDRGFRVLESSSVEDAKKFLPIANNINYSIIDLRMPGESGIELIRPLLKYNENNNIIILTGFGSIANAMEALKAGAVDYLTKPVDVDQIIQSLKGIRRTSNSYYIPSLDQVEWEHIQRVLQETGGNISQTARLLGIHRRSLQRKLDKYSPSQ